MATLSRMEYLEQMGIDVYVRRERGVFADGQSPRAAAAIKAPVESKGVESKGT